MSTGDQAFVRSTAKKPGRRFAYMMLLGLGVAAVIFLSMVYFRVPAETSNLVYHILMFGTFIGVLFGSVFITGMVGDFLGRRIETASEVADCVVGGGSEGECSKKVSGTRGKR